MNHAMIDLQMNQQGMPTSLTLLPFCIIGISLEGLLQPYPRVFAVLTTQREKKCYTCCYKGKSFQAQARSGQPASSRWIFSSLDCAEFVSNRLLDAGIPQPRRTMIRSVGKCFGCLCRDV